MTSNKEKERMEPRTAVTSGNEPIHSWLILMLNEQIINAVVDIRGERGINFNLALESAYSPNWDALDI